MANNIESIGIIGRGPFAQLLAELAPKDVKVQMIGNKAGDDEFLEVAASDVVILSIPFAAIQQVLDRLKPVLPDGSLLVDVCSVKVRPAELIHATFPDHPNLLITHPLFGPQTFHNHRTPHKLIVTQQLGQLAKSVVQFCENALSLDIIRMSDEEHDKHMANVHALTMFIGRACSLLDVASEPIRTPSFQKLVDLEALDRGHSEELFRTIETGNPFAKAARQKLLNTLSIIERELEV